MGDTIRPAQKKSTKGSTPIWKRIDDFVKFNSYALVIGISLSFLFLYAKLANLADVVENTLVKNTQFIKEDIGHPIFLSATGQVIVAKRSPLSYSDPRIISYIQNYILDDLVGGVVKLSGNYTATYSSGDDMLRKYSGFKDFSVRFLREDSSMLLPYVNNLFLAIKEDTLPNYINVVSSRMEGYSVKKLSRKDGGDGLTHIRGRVIGRTVVKSWIEDLKKWDTRDMEMSIPFELVVNVPEYADIGNPFGFHFVEIEVPLLKKPSAREVLNGKS